MYILNGSLHNKRIEVLQLSLTLGAATLSDSAHVVLWCFAAVQGGSQDILQEL